VRGKKGGTTEAMRAEGKKGEEKRDVHIIITLEMKRFGIGPNTCNASMVERK
jgi:hypothetical protein